MSTMATLPKGPSPAAPCPRILLIEADADTRAMVAMALRLHHYDVDVAMDTAGAIQCLRAYRYDLVMVHYGLPDRNGAVLLREAATAGLLRGAATMIITGQPDPRGIEGFALFRKPIDPPVLLREVQTILGAPPPEPHPLAPSVRVELVLYVGDPLPASLRARENIERLLAAYDRRAIDFKVRDTRVAVEEAEADRVVFTPTLVKRSPEPRAWVIGDLSNAEVVASVLDICAVAPLAH